MQAPDEACGGWRAGQDGQLLGMPVARMGLAAGGGSEPWYWPDRRREIGTRLAAVRARLKELRERNLEDGTRLAVTTDERLEAAQRRTARAQAAAARMLVSSAAAFGHAAEAHERAARAHERSAVGGVGDVIGHERQAALHLAAAAADWRRADRAQLLLAETERAWPAAVGDEPRDGVAS